MQGLQGGGSAVVRDWGRELRRGQLPGARRLGAPALGGKGHHRQELCQDSRDQSQEAR